MDPRLEVIAVLALSCFLVAAAQYDVVVVGAGISGLSAAASLQAAGYKVIILEARARVGGRIWSQKINGKKYTVDFGASWVHGIDNNPVYSIVKANKIKTLTTNYDSGVEYNKGKELSDSASAALDNLYEDWFAFQNKQAAALDGDKSLGSTVDAYIAQEELSGAQQDGLWYRVHQEIEDEYAASVYDMSLASWQEDNSLEGDDVLFPGGYQQVINAIAKGLAIKTATPVARIKYGASSASVTTQSGKVYNAKAVVVTVPLGVLKANALQFSPPLPAAKQGAIKLMKMGLLQKVVLVFPRKFWDDTEWIGRVPHAPKRGQWAQFLNLHAYYKVPMLLCFNSGKYSWAAEAMTDAQFAAAAMGALREMYGANIPAPTEVHVSRWGSDPYSRGSYSFLGVGSTGKEHAMLAAPVGKSLFFAGEATHTSFPATVHGAYMSGQQAAKDIRKAGITASKRG